MASTTPVRPEGSRTGLGPGSIVGGRFEIERAAGEDAIGTLLAARDQKTNRPIAVRVLSPGLIATPQALEIHRVASGLFTVAFQSLPTLVRIEDRLEPLGGARRDPLGRLGFEISGQTDSGGRQLGLPQVSQGPADPAPLFPRER